MPEKKRVAVVCPSDDHTIEVVKRCRKSEMAEFILFTTGSKSETERNFSDTSILDVRYAANADEAAAMAVEAVRNSEADVVMKGAINTDNLLKAVLNKQHGLLPAGRVLTHITAAQTPAYHKLLFFSDAAVIPNPQFEQLEAMLSYGVALLKKLNISNPKIALIHFSEKINEKFPHTIFYQQLKAEAKTGRFGNEIVVDGPMDCKTACDKHSAQIKHIETPINGDADFLIFPNLEAGNTFYKSLSLFGNATMAGILCGADAPIVIPSRADTAESKFYSLALACINSQQ